MIGCQSFTIESSFCSRWSWRRRSKNLDVCEHLPCNGRDFVHHVDDFPIFELESPRIIKRKQLQDPGKLKTPIACSCSKANALNSREVGCQYVPSSNLLDNTPPFVS